MLLITELVEDVQVLKEETSDGKKNYFIEGIIMQGDIKNRNGRVYPMKTLMRETNRYIKENVDKNRAYGELGHPCFWDKTEALTVDGWKYIKDVKDGEYIYSINRDSNEVELKKNIKTNINQYKGKLLHFKGRGIDFAVTPYHKILLVDRNNNLIFKTAQEVYDAYRTNDPKIKKMYIPQNSNGHVQENKNISIGTKDIDLYKFSAFLGFYLAEGCTLKRKNREDSYKINLFQKCEYNKSFEEIDSMLNSLHPDIKFSSYETKKNHYVWTSHNKDLAKYLYSLGNCYDKYIPDDFKRVCGNVESKEFIDWFIKGDGRGNIDEKYSRTDAFSSSKRLIEDISELGVMAGISISFFEIHPSADRLIEGRTIKQENQSNMYFIRFKSSKGVYIDNRFLSIEEIDWDSDVYCLTVEDNSTFFVRDGGYSFWTGNCGPTINLDRVSHMFTSLKEDGTNIIGRAKIMDTPMGKIVKNFIDEGAYLGISSRGMGSLKSNSNGIMEVQEDFMLATAGDLVADPSAPDAFVNGIMEGVSFYHDLASGNWMSANELDKIEEDIKETAKVSIRDLEEKAELLYHKFLTSLGSK